jgi:hypothetical protein
LLPPSFLRISGRRPGFPSAWHRDAECAQGRYIGIRYPICRRSRQSTSTASRKPHGFSGGHPSASVRCSTPANYRGSTRARTRTHRGRFTESRSTHAGTGAEARVTRRAFLPFARSRSYALCVSGPSLVSTLGPPFVLAQEAVIPLEHNVPSPAVLGLSGRGYGLQEVPSCSIAHTSRSDRGRMRPLANLGGADGSRAR